MAKILLIGDTIMNKMPIDLLDRDDDIIINKGIKNIGISTYHKCVWPIIKEEDAEFIFVLLGLTNILRPNCDSDDKNITLKDLFNKFSAFIDEIRHTGKQVIVQSLYPTRSEWVNESIKIINEFLEEICYQADIEYLDLYDLLCDSEGLLREDYTTDGYEITEKAYRLIACQMTDLIDVMQKKR